MTTTRTGRRLLPTLLMLAASAAALPAQEARQALDESRMARSDSGAERSLTLQAVRIEGGAVEVDGLLDEAAWAGAQLAGNFVQLEPQEGAPASQATEARVLYASDALYVGIRAYDSAPDSIVGQLTRRDRGGYSDWVHFFVDSYHDQRTAFHFGVNPVGVKIDLYRYDDTSEDSSWDAVWDVATHVDEEGWTAEFRVPFSQLRFADQAVQTWGINFAREIARHQETSTWAPLSQNENRMVSRSGTLEGIRDVEPASRLEIQPYVWGKADRQSRDAASPFFEATEWSSEVGADVKYRITSDLTLDMTINPDFGQVEADPAQLNLTANEIYLSERRPFFVEGGNIFAFGIGLGDGDNESLFYSRRIGRSPQGSVDRRGGFVDAPDQTRIWGAWKLSGKTESGWSLGFLHAATSEETASIVSADGERFEDPVEPFTNYSVARVQRDFREGRSAVGGVATATVREDRAAESLGLHSSAFTGGLDFRHRFGEDGHYEMLGYVLGSHVRGDESAIARTQRSPVRYFQRPDADHLEYDPSRTSLTGWAANVALRRFGGSRWRFGTDVVVRSPGFEANDVGFQQDADMIIQAGFLGYRVTDPGDVFRRWGVNVNAWHAYTFGGERISLAGNVNGNFTLLNQWGGYAGVNYQHERLSNGFLRGGPAMLIDPGLNGWLGLYSDTRNDLRFNLNGNWSVYPESDSWSWNVSPGATWRPTEAASVNLGTFFSRNADDRQWVGRTEAGGSDHWVLGRLDQTTVGITARLDYSFTPELSLQLYAQPYVSAGEYGAFKQVADPRAASYEDRVALLDYRPAAGGGYEADLDGDGTFEGVRDPDFNFKQFRSNAVLRWEYRPGSTLFLVWSQGRDHYVGDGAFGARDDMDTLFSVRPENVFMVKLSYWLNP